MKKQFASLIVLSAFGCAGPLLSETTQSKVQLCLAAQTTVGAAGDAADGCTDLRAAYTARLGACMAERQLDAQRSHSANASSISHGFKARYLLCSRDAQDSLEASEN